MLKALVGPRMLCRFWGGRECRHGGTVALGGFRNRGRAVLRRLGTWLVRTPRKMIGRRPDQPVTKGMPARSDQPQTESPGVGSLR